jgi:signal transduction histidine kinase
LRFESRRLFTALVRDISERKALEKEVLDVAAQEQRRIGQDLHDSVGQELTGLGLVAESLLESLAKQAHPDQELAVMLAGGVKRIFAQIRALSRGLIPLEVNADELAGALRQLAANIAASSDVKCTFSGGGLNEWDDNFGATHLYRIAQEAVTNALKHARAKHIRISLESTGQDATLSVTDDGVGLGDPAADSQGIGLRIMRYRADLINAVLSIDAVKGRGTSVTCTYVTDKNHEPKQEGRN